jgi:hypothetical protein
MYIIKTDNFGTIEVEDDVDKFLKKLILKDNEFIDLYFQNLNGNISVDNIKYLRIILDAYYKIKNNSIKYIIENYDTNNEINYYFEDLFAERFGGTFGAYIKIKTGDADELYRLMELPIEDKIKYMPVPDLIIHFSEEKQYDIKMIFNSVKDEYKTSLWFHYDNNLILTKFWVDEIDPWK